MHSKQNEENECLTLTLNRKLQIVILYVGICKL